MRRPVQFWHPKEDDAKNDGQCRCALCEHIRTLEAELAGLRAINQKGGHGIHCPQLLARAEKAEAEIERLTRPSAAKPAAPQPGEPGFLRWRKEHEPAAPPKARCEECGRQDASVDWPTGLILCPACKAKAPKARKEE